MARRILGLDLGSHAVKAAELRQTFRGLEVVQLRDLPLEEPTPSLATELRELLRAHDLPTEHVVVAVPGDRLSTRRLHFPFRDRRRLGAAVPFELEAQVPFDLQDFVVDWEVVGGGREGSDVVATLVPRSEVATLLETTRAAGLEPRTVEAEGLVLANLAGVLELPGTRLLAELGHRKTTLCLCADGRPLAARTLPWGGRALDEAIEAERGVSPAEAERIKQEEGVLGGPGRRHSPGGSAAVERLGRELVRTLGALEPLLDAGGAGPLEEITLLGGSAHLHGLEEALSRRTGLRARRLQVPPGEGGAASALLAGGDPLRFAPALALGVRGSLRARTRTNLRQHELARRLDLRRMGRELRSTAVLALLALLLGGATVATDLSVHARRARDLEQRAAALYRSAFPERPLPESPVSGMREAVRRAEERAETLGVYRGNLSALDVLTEISKRVPSGLEVVFEEVSINRQVIQIKGHSPSFGAVDRLRAELADFEPFSEVTVGDITSDERRGGQTFSLRIRMGRSGEAS